MCVCAGMHYLALALIFKQPINASYNGRRRGFLIPGTAAFIQTLTYSLTQGLRRYASLGFFGSLPLDWSSKMVLYSDDPKRYSVISMDSFFRHTSAPYSSEMLTWLIRKACVAFSAAKANGLTRCVAIVFTGNNSLALIY